MKVEIYKGKSLTAAEISLMHLYERREEAYQIAEEKRKKELQLVNESIASMINPVVAAPEEKDTAMDEAVAEDPDEEEEKEVVPVIEHDAEKYKDYSKPAALASGQLKEKLSAQEQA